LWFDLLDANDARLDKGFTKHSGPLAVAATTGLATRPISLHQPTGFVSGPMTPALQSAPTVIYRGWRGLAVAVVLTLLALPLAAARPAGATSTFMSCGYPPVDDPYLEEVRPGKVRYRSHPRNCDWSENGSTASLINLVKIRWKHWGGRRAYARAFRVDNHDMDHNGFQRHRVRVEVFAPRPAFGHPGQLHLFYSKLRISEQGRSGVENLYRPGQPPVSLPYYRAW
jgi:hypothetical protein